jgi:hypothetical protein
MTSKPKILIWDIDYQIQYDGSGVLSVIGVGCRKHKRALTKHVDNNGYYRFKLNNKPLFEHVFIAEMFLGKRPDGLVINHKDGNKLNNNIDNLEYVTIAENIRHAVINGMHVSNNPTRSGRYKDGRTIGRRSEYKKEWRKARKELIGSYT